MFQDKKVIFEFRGPFGVPVQIGSSIMLLVMVFLFFGSNATQIYYNAIFLALLIGSIFLHELGHAWGTIVQGIPVRRIMIYGGGGFCERSRSASVKQDELIVAMRPIVNLVIWALASLSLPMMALSYFTFGLVLFFMPPIGLHLQMLRRKI